MQAQTGDWLVVTTHTEGRQERRGLILAVHNEAGDPPFTVRWLDNGHEGIVFPGPDAVVMSAAEQARRHDAAVQHAAAVQETITLG